ncbi:MAG: DsrE family protein [Desulfamplus sp.]|nr:DsrE family protein [Desulfamplus sp.]
MILAVVISNPGLEELLSPLGFALGAALGGIDVYIYFQGPAIKVLKSDFKEKLRGINWLFSGFARDGLSAIGHIPPQEKLKQLKELGTHFYACSPSMDHFGVNKNDLIFDNVIMAEYLTFMEIMNNADIHMLLQ